MSCPGAPDCSFRVVPTELPGVVTIEPTVFEDGRGFFLASYNQSVMARAGIPELFVQDNHSRSKRGVLRGLHYQLPPHAQGKLVRVVAGEIFDAAADLRRSSPLFGRWVGLHLSAQNKRMMWIPPGFAHGYIVLSEQADVVYKVTDSYCPHCERTIRWDDPSIGIRWPLQGKPNLSSKDALGSTLDSAEVFD